MLPTISEVETIIFCIIIIRNAPNSFTFVTLSVLPKRDKTAGPNCDSPHARGLFVYPLLVLRQLVATPYPSAPLTRMNRDPLATSPLIMVQLPQA